MSQGRAAGIGIDLSWQVLVSELPIAVAVTDQAGVPLASSRAFERLVDPQALAVGVRSAVGVPVQVRPDEINLITSPSERVASVRSRAGESLRCSVRPLSTSAATSYLVVHLPPPTAIPRDALTGLVLRDVLVTQLERALARQNRHGGEVEIVVFDLDRFKPVNDTYGHKVGDEVLVEVSRRISGLSRPEDTVCRWGGDEFVVLLEEPDRHGGEAICHRIRKALEEPVLTCAGLLQISGSSGWVRSRHGEASLDLLHRADLGMYADKRLAAHGGRDAASAGSALTGRLEDASRRAVLLRATMQSALDTASELVDWRLALLRGSSDPSPAVRR